MRDGLGCRDIPALSTLISLVRTLSVPLCKDLGNVLYLTVLDEKATGRGEQTNKVII